MNLLSDGDRVILDGMAARGHVNGKALRRSRGRDEVGIIPTNQAKITLSPYYSDRTVTLLCQNVTRWCAKLPEINDFVYHRDRKW